MAWDPIGGYRHLVTLENPSGKTPDGEGGYTQTWAPCVPPTMHAAIDVAGAGDQERLTSGTVISQATHVLRMRYHPELSTQTRLTFHGRAFSVTAVHNLEERQQRLLVLCAEVTT